jgi:hypothetical protein
MPAAGAAGWEITGDGLIGALAPVERVVGMGMLIVSWPAIGDGAIGDRGAEFAVACAWASGGQQAQARHSNAVIARPIVLDIQLSPSPACASRRECVSTLSAFPYAELLAV